MFRRHERHVDWSQEDIFFRKGKTAEIGAGFWFCFSEESTLYRLRVWGNRQKREEALSSSPDCPRGLYLQSVKIQVKDLNSPGISWVAWTFFPGALGPGGMGHPFHGLHPCASLVFHFAVPGISHKAWCLRDTQKRLAFFLPSFLLSSLSSASGWNDGRMEQGLTGHLRGGRQIKHPSKSPWTEHQPHNADLGQEPTVHQPPPGLWDMAN